MSWLIGLFELLRRLAAIVEMNVKSRADAILKDDGAARAEAATLDVVAETANDQSEVNARPRDPRSVGERLQRDE